MYLVIYIYIFIYVYIYISIFICIFICGEDVTYKNAGVGIDLEFQVLLFTACGCRAYRRE